MMMMMTMPAMIMAWLEGVETKIVFSEMFPFVLKCTTIVTRIANNMLDIKTYKALSLNVYQSLINFFK
jgi:hypothetical protein